MQHPIYAARGGPASGKHRGGTDLTEYDGPGTGYGASLFLFSPRQSEYSHQTPERPHRQEAPGRHIGRTSTSHPHPKPTRATRMKTSETRETTPSGITGKTMMMHPHPHPNPLGATRMKTLDTRGTTPTGLPGQLTMMHSHPTSPPETPRGDKGEDIRHRETTPTGLPGQFTMFPTA